MMKAFKILLGYRLIQGQLKDDALIDEAKQRGKPKG
jgi:hypothetical protein